MSTTALIKIWNKRVGAIAWNAATEYASFEFEPAFLANKWDLAPLKMPISGAKRQIFSFPELRNPITFKGLPGLIADSLPDSFGNSLINAWLTYHGRPLNSLNPIEHLCFIGKRGMGALEFEPVEPISSNNATQIELDSLIQITGNILSGQQYNNSSISSDKTNALNNLFKTATTVGGGRAKALIAFNPDNHEFRSGQTEVPKGFSHWILKFDGLPDQQIGLSSGYGRIEMAYHLMAREAGIEMTECRLLEENGRAHFMTRRFDRPDEKQKLHVQSFCALTHYDFNEIRSNSYEQLFETMRSLLLPYTDAEQLYRRMVFNVLAKNCNDHTKNFSFCMDKSGKWKLSPAYDMCYSYRQGSTWVSQHALSINGKRQFITRDDLIEVAKNMNIKKADSILLHIASVVSRWNEFAERTKVQADLRDAISKTLVQV